MKEIINNIQEPICSSEVSQLLKEKEFDVPCFNVYEKDKTPLFDSFREAIKNSEISKNTFITAPTHSVALEWIRVNFGVHIRVERNYRRPLLDEPAPEPVFTVDIDNLHSKSGKAYSDVVNGCFDTPQEAIEAGLLYALTKLIP
jgi:hypothetical protein